ncbi:MAG: hypothetical protein SH868_01010 [Bythopirellula sp.]|nr:hypothetical protein [Bythopirellula sp.]
MNDRIQHANESALQNNSTAQLLEAATIVQLLTQCVRVVGAHQLRGLDQRQSIRLLKRLHTLGMVSVRTVIVPPDLSLTAPLFRWQPGVAPPKFDRLAWQLAARWRGKPHKVLIASATAETCYSVGSSFAGRVPRRTEVSHDLHVTAIYLNLARAAPERARQWIHEDALHAKREAGQLIPDAMLGGTAIEFGGRYRADKLRAIHRGHAIAGRPYEIW